MDETYPLALALFDFVPVTFFSDGRGFLGENFHTDVRSSLWTPGNSRFATHFSGRVL